MMEPGYRLQLIERLGQLRAELSDCNYTLSRLCGSAWAEEEACEGGPTVEVPEAEKAAELAPKLAKLIADAYRSTLTEQACQSSASATADGGDINEKLGATEEELRKLVESGRMLVCAAPSGDLCGCCAVACPAPTGRESEAIGTISLLAVRQESRRKGLGVKLLHAAEERLATKHECGLIRVEIPLAVGGRLTQWFRSRGYGSRMRELMSHATSVLSPLLRPQSPSMKPRHSNGGYAAGSGAGSGGVLTLTKRLQVGFVTRALARDVKRHKAMLEEELASLEAANNAAASATAAAAQQARTAGDDSVDMRPCEVLCDSPLVCLPVDVWASLSGLFGLKEVGAMTCSCRLFKQELQDSELWRGLFDNLCWPPSQALLQFSESILESIAGADWKERLRRRATSLPVIVVDIGRGYTKYGIVHGLNGRPEGEGGPPRLVQLCSSPTHPPDCEHNEQLQFITDEVDKALVRAAFDRQHPLHKVAIGDGRLEPEINGTAVLRDMDEEHAELNGRQVIIDEYIPDGDIYEVHVPPQSAPHRMSGFSPFRPGARATTWKGLVARRQLTPIRSANELPMLVGEPFAITAQRSDHQDRARWGLRMQSQVADRLGSFRIVPQAQMSLWSHAIDHGIVVNIGQGQTIAVPVVMGEIVHDACCNSEIGSGSLTQLMMRLLHQRYNYVDSRLMTWCRDLKEEHCYVAPPATRSNQSLLQRLSAGDDRCALAPVQVEVPFIGQTQYLELSTERMLVPEAFFDASILQGPTLPQLIVRCVEKVLQKEACRSAESLQALLRNIVLVGGAADIPGMRPRTEFEVRRLLATSASAELREQLVSPDDAYVLNPPLACRGARGGAPLTSPRFVPFFGGCVRATSSRSVVSAKTPLAHAPGGHRQSVDAAKISHSLAALPGVGAWIRRALFGLNAPAIFRAGGGGGEEDHVWDGIHQDYEDAEEDYDDHEVPSELELGHESCEEEDDDDSSDDSDKPMPAAAATAPAAQQAEDEEDEPGQ
eukprot:TRINITY_DN4404_c0_g1_i2.p1 TRINITY_DN4404_c0_g1~~TRINITY_DN4404_c0_g1_i2.p1  ORF type:complete len:1000 (+),score=264.78 TRINITY_DN4404_c0_g1_i2:70-3069(+)